MRAVKTRRLPRELQNGRKLFESGENVGLGSVH